MFSPAPTIDFDFFLDIDGRDEIGQGTASWQMLRRHFRAQQFQSAKNLLL